MTKAILVVFMLTALATSGCATYYQVIRIPDTPDGLAAYRQCAIAPHFKEVAACMAGIPGVNGTGWMDNSSQFKILPLCREIISGSFDTKNAFTWPLPSGHYYYSIQAYQDIPAPISSGNDDSSGVPHIDHAKP